MSAIQICAMICAIVGIAILAYGFLSQYSRANRLEKQLKHLKRSLPPDPKVVAELFLAKEK